MAIKDFIVASGKYGAYNHYQLRLKKLIVQKTTNLIYQEIELIKGL